MNNDFTFDDETKDILTNASKSKQGRPAKAKEEKRSKCINCYLTEEEYKQFMIFLEDRPASIYLRKHILKVSKPS